MKQILMRYIFSTKSLQSWVYSYSTFYFKLVSFPVWMNTCGCPMATILDKATLTQLFALSQPELSKAATNKWSEIFLFTKPHCWMLTDIWTKKMSFYLSIGTITFLINAQPLGHSRPFLMICIRCSLRHNINPAIMKMIYCTINILRSLKQSDLYLQHCPGWLIKQHTVVNGYCKQFPVRKYSSEKCSL